MTLKNVPTTRKAIVNQLREKHEKLFKLENLEKPAKFIPKMAYVPKSGDERVISFFPSEILGGEDIYTEFVSKSLEPEDPERQLWKWLFNPEFDIEYQKTEPHPTTGHQQFLIPVAELINVAEVHAKKSNDVKPIPEVNESTPIRKQVMPIRTNNKIDPIETMDAPIGQMTIKDKAAIDWKRPVSDKPWLNELIKDTFNLK